MCREPLQKMDMLNKRAHAKCARHTHDTSTAQTRMYTLAPAAVSRASALLPAQNAPHTSDHSTLTDRPRENARERNLSHTTQGKQTEAHTVASARNSIRLSFAHTKPISQTFTVDRTAMKMHTHITHTHAHTQMHKVCHTHAHDTMPTH